MAQSAALLFTIEIRATQSRTEGRKAAKDRDGMRGKSGGFQHITTR